MVDATATTLVPERLIARIVERLDPDEIWLFGSRADGTARADSDYDLFVVLPDGAEVSVEKAYEARRGTGIAADVVPCRRSDFEATRDRIGTLSYTAYHLGRKIYDC